VSVGLERLRTANKSYGRVVRLLVTEEPSEELHAELRQCLHDLRGAMNYLEYEDMDQFDVAHARLDAAGRLAREIFPKGCLFVFKDEQYHQQCPVALAHNRAGLSLGMKVKAMECSICEGDPDECEHVRGRECGGQACVHIITDAEVMEVSLVGKPAQPDARLTSISVSTSTMRSKLGEFAPGVPVTCDKCLSSCDGVHWPTFGR
jgi:hypothetical protein